MTTGDNRIVWKSKVMATALGVVVVGLSSLPAASHADPSPSVAVSKEVLLNAAQFVRQLPHEDSASQGGGVQEAQWMSYFNNWGNWNNWGNFNQWSNF